MATTTVATGVHRIEHAATNTYLVELEQSLLFVDAGLPRTRAHADRAVHDLGASWDDVEAIVLTHGHFDHLGFAAWAHDEHGVAVWVHPGDVPIVRHPYRYRPGRPRALYPVLHPRSIPPLASMVVAGALRVRGVRSVSTFGASGLPGGLHVVETPGHTDGHCALHLPDRDVLFTGDGLVTLDPYTGRRGPRIVARAGTRDATTARASLAAMAATEATVVLPGHGEPWTRGVAAAASAAAAQDTA